MNKEEFIGKLQLVYVGDKRASKEIISEYDRLNNIINELEKYIVNEINNANEELNVIMKGNDLAYKNECSKEFNCIKKFVDKTLDKLQELKEGK